MLKWYVHEQGVRDFAIASASSHDLVQTVINGPSGIMRSYADNDPEKPTYSPHFSILKYPCGAVGRLVSSESPERARGLSVELLLGDELGSLSGDALDFWHQLEYGLRAGVSQAILATTPRATPLIIDLVERSKDPDGNVRVTTGSSLENSDNLTPQMIQKAKATMNTRLGKQEVMGELILTNPEACFTPDLLDKCKTTQSGEFHPSKWKKFAIGVDPAGESTSKASDKTGIGVAVLTESDKILVVRDASDRMTGQRTVAKIYSLYKQFSQFCPGKIHVEKSGIGGFMKSMILREHPFLPVNDFPSTTKKYARVMDASHKYETGIVFHDSNAELGDLESEQISWTGKGKSPDHIEGVVFAINGLMNNNHYVKRKQFIL